MIKWLIGIILITVAIMIATIFRYAKKWERQEREWDAKYEEEYDDLGGSVAVIEEKKKEK